MLLALALACASQNQDSADSIADPTIVSYRATGVLTVALRSDGSFSWWGHESGDSPPDPFAGMTGKYRDLAASRSVTCGLTLEGQLECSVEGGEALTIATGPFDGLEFRGRDACVWTQNGPLVCHLWESGWAVDPDPRFPSAVTQVSADFTSICWLDPNGKISCIFPSDVSAHESPDEVFTTVSVYRGVGGLTPDGRVASGNAVYPTSYWEFDETYLRFDAGQNGYVIRQDGTLDSRLDDSWEYPDEVEFAELLVAHETTPCGIATDGVLHCWNPKDRADVIYPSQDWPEIEWFDQGF